MAQTIRVLGIDIATLVFHVVGMADTGHVVLRKRLAHSELLTFIANLPPLRIGMEACGSAHYWARCFREHGHDVRLIAPQFVKAYLKLPKNDTRDAEAICEAVTRPTIVDGNQSCEIGPVLWELFLSTRVPRLRRAVNPCEINDRCDGNTITKSLCSRTD